MELIVVGCQSGDEGKGKFTDFLAEGAYAVVRYQAGPHTGHTVSINGETFRFIQVPAGVLRGAIGVLGNGCVIEPLSLLEELAALEARVGRVSLQISEAAHVVMPYHPLQDEGLERVRGGVIATSADSGFSTGSGQLGSTKRGVGPCREDKIARIGLRMVDLLDRELLRARLEVLLPLKVRLLQHVFGIDPRDYGVSLSLETLVETYHAVGLELAPYLADVSAFLRSARARERFIVYEGAQSLALDVEHGTYPYCSSGYSAASGMTVGTGSPPGTPVQTVGVAKAYMVQVGGGPLPTELTGELADYLVDRGREVGTVTGRRRRVGWLDLAFLRRAVRIDGIRQLCLSNVDVLGGLAEVKVATHYLVDGQRVDEYPTALRDAARVVPVYRTFEGWSDRDWRQVAARGPGALPPSARRYVEWIAGELDVELAAISVGPDRAETIIMRSPVSLPA